MAAQQQSVSTDWYNVVPTVTHMLVLKLILNGWQTRHSKLSRQVHFHSAFLMLLYLATSLLFSYKLPSWNGQFKNTELSLKSNRTGQVGGAQGNPVVLASVNCSTSTLYFGFRLFWVFLSRLKFHSPHYRLLNYSPSLHSPKLCL